MLFSLVTKFRPLIYVNKDVSYKIIERGQPLECFQGLALSEEMLVTISNAFSVAFFLAKICSSLRLSSAEVSVKRSNSSLVVPTGRRSPIKDF